MKRCLATLVATVLLVTSVALAQPTTNPEGTPADTKGRVITLGADLEPDQRVSVLRVFGFTADQAAREGVTILVVTNAEERAMLGQSVPESAIGTRAISSAYVEKRAAGQGIAVERYNITFVTDAMYGNALATGGVRDARVVVAAPTPVSGTAALTGIFKAFERVTGRALPEQAKSTAGEELVTTGQLGDELGNKKVASELMARVKEQVAGKRATNPAEVRPIVVKVAADLNVKLTTEQVDKVTDVAVKVGQLGVSAGDLRDQVRSLRENISNLNPAIDTRSILQKLVDFLSRLFSQFFSTVVGLMSRK